MPADPVERLLAEQLETMREQFLWIRAAAIPQIRETVERELDTTEKRRAYNLCDGTRKSNEIGAELGVAKSTISTWGAQWRELGIATQAEGRRIRHLASLATFGIEETVERNKD